MEVLLFLFVFFLGASVGNFVNVLIDRLPRGISIFFNRSHCEVCKKKLTPQELIPIVSYLALRGKCKKCKSKIPTRILLVEFINGLLYYAVFSLYIQGNFYLVELVYLLILLPIFLGIFFADFEFGIIPDELVVVALVVIVSYLVFYSPNLVINHFLSGAFLLFFFLLIYLVTSARGMGFGDVKLSFVLGLFLGFPIALVSMYLAFLTGAAVSLILIAWGKKKLKKDTIPFGPFLIFSTLTSYFFGDLIISKVLELFNL